MADFRLLGDVGFGVAGEEIACLQTGQFDDALRYLSSALENSRELGDRHGEARTLTSLGETYGLLHRLDEALAHHGQALELISHIGSRSLGTAAHNGFGSTLRACGRTAEALAHHREALALAREVGEPLQEAKSLDGVAHCLAAADGSDEAAATWSQAMAVFAALHHPEASRIADRLRRPGTVPSRYRDPPGEPRGPGDRRGSDGSSPHAGCPPG